MVSIKRTTSVPELLLAIGRDAATPLRAQIERELRTAIQTGRLRQGMPLPSSRALAADLSLSRGVVVEAYEQLLAEGYLIARRGSATRVATRTTRAGPSAGPGRGRGQERVAQDVSPGRARPCHDVSTTMAISVMPGVAAARALATARRRRIAGGLIFRDQRQPRAVVHLAKRWSLGRPT